MGRVDFSQAKRSSFSSAGKDLYTITQSILGNQRLLKLLYYSTPNALKEKDLTDEQKTSLINKSIRVVPQIPIPEEAQSHIIISFDNFMTNANNPEFRDNIVTFDVLCPTEDWVMDDYMLRPYKIMHEIDSMFNKSKLNGIGKVDFISTNSLVLSRDLAGFTMAYGVINDV